MNHDLKKPCPHCPFRSDVKPFLSYERVDEIIRTVCYGGEPFPCHETTEHDDEGEAIVTNSAQMCAGAMIMLVLLLIQLVLGVSIGIAACFATGYLLGTSFGYLGEACIKLAAIFTFPMAVAVLVPGGICVMVIVFPLLYFGLLLWLFDLQFLEGFFFTLVLAGTQFLAGWLIGLIL